MYNFEVIFILSEVMQVMKSAREENICMKRNRQFSQCFQIDLYAFIILLPSTVYMS